MCDTEKPKRSGCAAKSRLISVDLPVPEGPEKTIGRPGGEAGVGAILEIVALLMGLEQWCILSISRDSS